MFPFPADTTSLPVSILLTGKFTYSSGGLHPFLHFFDVLLSIFPGYFICLCLLNFLILPQDLVLYPLLLSTKHLAHPGLVFQADVLFSMSPVQHWILFFSCLTQMVSVSSQAMLGLKFIESMSIPLICQPYSASPQISLSCSKLLLGHFFQFLSPPHLYVCNTGCSLQFPGNCWTPVLEGEVQVFAVAGESPPSLRQNIPCG